MSQIDGYNGEIGEMMRKENPRAEIDLISIGKLIVLLVKMWKTKTIMGIIMGITG